MHVEREKIKCFFPYFFNETESHGSKKNRKSKEIKLNKNKTNSGFIHSFDKFLWLYNPVSVKSFLLWHFSDDWFCAQSNATNLSFLYEETELLHLRAYNAL